MPRQPRLIKKYANRRLYDTGTSQSITLNDVRDLIGAGEPVRVVEAKTGKDVTRAILLQIVADQELFGRPALSDEVLTAIIRLNSNPMRDLTREFLEQGMRQLKSQQARLDETWRAGLRKAGLESVADLSGTPMEQFGRFQQEVFSMWADALNSASRKHAGESDEEDDTKPT